MKELELLLEELGDMYDELVARVLSFNTIHKKYASYDNLYHLNPDNLQEQYCLVHFP